MAKAVNKIKAVAPIASHHILYGQSHLNFADTLTQVLFFFAIEFNIFFNNQLLFIVY